MMSEQFSMLFGGYSLMPLKISLFQRRNYEFCTMEYVLSGRGFLEINGECFELGPDSVYILHKHSDHKYYPDKNDPWQKIYFLFDGELVEQLIKYYSLDHVYAVPGCESCKEFFLSMLNLKREEFDVQGLLLFHRLLEQLFRLTHSHGGNAETPAEKLKHCLENSVKQRFLLKDYAVQQGFSEGHLIRSFRSAYGEPPHLYLLNLRLQGAKQALLYSDLAVKEIAEQFCFSSQYYFSNVFKQKYKLSPQQFRSKYRT